MCSSATSSVTRNGTTEEQAEALKELNEIVRNTEAAREAEAAGQIVFLPTGDGWRWYSRLRSTSPRFEKIVASLAPKEPDK